MKLSAHFSTEEFERSERAARMGREIPIPEAYLPNLRGLVREILEPFRVTRGRVIAISSGYRPGWLNKAVGGSKKSQHMTASAADFIEQGASPFETALAMSQSGLPFDQVILEFDAWCHVSWSLAPRGSILTARKVDGKTAYLTGIVEKPA